jgi:peptide/nickel transport system permease protein
MTLPSSYSASLAAEHDSGLRLMETRLPASRHYRPSPELIAGCAIVAALALAALLGPVVVKTDPRAQDLMARFQPPLGFGGTSDHPLGTDGLGRDLLARLLAGARVSLLLGAGATIAAAALGVLLGVLGGWFGGRVEHLTTWLTDVQAIVPFIVIAVAVTATLGNTLRGVLLTLALTGWVGYARVIGLQARSLKHAGWVESARAVGATPWAIIGRHILPGLVATIAILATQQISAMILYEAALSYLGLGLGGDAITWGSMAAQGQQAIWTAPWVAALPGLAVAINVLGFNLIGDAVAARAASGA